MGIRAKTQDQLDPKVLARHREQEGEEALIIAEQPPPAQQCDHDRF